MGNDVLLHARQKAEQAVKSMKDGPLKIAAFQTILAKLLDSSEVLEGKKQSKPIRSKGSAGGQPTTRKDRILAIQAEGFFETQRTLGEVRQALGTRGWHYAVTALSGAMQELVRNRDLRREKVPAGAKKVWKYSNP
jgi:hypothetical protein